MDVSVYHNAISIGSHSSSQIYVWHYEHGKLMGAIDLQGETPVSIQMLNGPAILAVGTASGKLYLLAMTTPHSSLEAEFHLLACLTAPSPITAMQATLTSSGRGKQAVTSSCCLSAVTQEHALLTYDCTQVVTHVPHKPHAKHKTNYNPLREGKENFATELQKILKSTFTVPLSSLEPALTPSIIETELVVTSLKVLQLPQPARVVAGNDNRIKIWDENNLLTCDLNISVLLG